MNDSNKTGLKTPRKMNPIISPRSGKKVKDFNYMIQSSHITLESEQEKFLQGMVHVTGRSNVCKNNLAESSVQQPASTKLRKLPETIKKKESPKLPK
jgi:hypothetical protein